MFLPFYYPQTSKLISEKSPGSHGSIEDSALIHRMVHVLRMQEGNQCILFDEQHSIICQIESVNQRTLVYSIKKISCNPAYQPKITVLLPLLKREALLESLYSVVELGASAVQLVTMQKAQHAWGGTKELERLNRIMQSAAEQSKNFAIPSLSEPEPLTSILGRAAQQSHKIFFDSDGCMAPAVLSTVQAENIAEIVMLVRSRRGFDSG